MRSRLTLSRIVTSALLTAALLLASPPARACTTFAAASAQGRLVAKGFDWSTGRGWLVWTERGRAYPPLAPGDVPLAGAPARFANLSLTTVAPGFPSSGMNEAGLVIEALVDAGSPTVQALEPGKLTSLELVQQGLGQFATAAELAAFAEKAGFTPLAVPLHLFACDRGGACVVVELEGSRVRVTRALPVAALANRPYAEELDDSRPPRGLLAWLGIRRLRAQPQSSQARFRAVADALQAGPLRDEPQALALLDRVAMGPRTRWQMIWNQDRATLALHQPAAGIGGLRVRLSDLRARCEGPVQVRPLGVAASRFEAWSPADEAAVQTRVPAQLRRSSPAVERLAAALGRVASASSCR